MWWVANQITEATDYVNAAYEALPYWVRRFKGRDGKWRDKDITPQDRLRRIYNNIDRLDMDQFAALLVENWAEDQAIGRTSGIFKEMVDIMKSMGFNRPVSLETGPSI